MVGGEGQERCTRAAGVGPEQRLQTAREGGIDENDIGADRGRDAQASRETVSGIRHRAVAAETSDQCVRSCRVRAGNHDERGVAMNCVTHGNLQLNVPDDGWG